MRPRHGRTALVAAFGYALNDPPARLAAESLAAAGWHTTVFQGPAEGVFPSPPPETVEVVEWRKPGAGARGLLTRLLDGLAFGRALSRHVRKRRPDVVATIMLHPLAVLPRFGAERPVLVSCVYDIPSPQDLGKLDGWFVRAGWAHLSDADVVWSSDRYKAELARQMGALRQAPIVCHNCPDVGWLPEPVRERDGWLRAELRRRGASLQEHGGCIVLRAGAVGERCGLEETLRALEGLPQDVVFLMMGRPIAPYRERLLRSIGQLGLGRRAFLWDRPSDESWKRALRGADVGHLIHGPHAPGPAQRMFELNSSLSNNRLFQYMAAGLPILAHDDPRMEGIYREVPCFAVASLASLREDVERILRDLHADPLRRAAMGRAAREAHVSRYRWDVQFEPVLAAIRSASQQRDAVLGAASPVPAVR